jgi:hypothetical protein
MRLGARPLPNMIHTASARTPNSSSAAQMRATMAGLARLIPFSIRP